MSLTSARVIHLPTAVSQPVQQTPRRGRFPKCVTTISEARFRVFQNQSVIQYQKELAQLERVASGFLVHAENCRYDAQVLKQKIEALTKRG